MGTLTPSFATHQQATCVIGTIRGLLEDGAVVSPAWQAVAWNVAIALLGIGSAGVLCGRRTR